MKKTIEEIIEDLEKLFDEYHGEQMRINDKQNPEYYLMMGKANGIGEAIDLLKEIEN